jgi:hypothetical protein
MDGVYIWALSKAWFVTVIAVSLFTASLAVAQVWDKAIYLRALQDTLVSDPV